jgi:hypothetical protein
MYSCVVLLLFCAFGYVALKCNHFYVKRLLIMTVYQEFTDLTTSRASPHHTKQHMSMHSFILVYNLY